MQTVSGYLDPAGNPCLKISVYGEHEQNKQEFEAFIDTGFSGFLSIPLLKALPCALILQSTASFTLADGSTRVHLLAKGTVILEDERQTGLIVLNNDTANILIGMDFFRLFKKALVVSQHAIGLIDEALVLASLQAAQQAAQPTPPPQTSPPNPT